MPHICPGSPPSGLTLIGALQRKKVHFSWLLMRVVAEILLALEPNNKLKQPLRIGNTSEISWNQKNNSSTYRCKPDQQSRKRWKSTPRTVANVSFSWNKYHQRLNNIKKTFFTLNRDKLRINLSNKPVGKHAYRPPSWIFLCFSLWPLYSLSLDRAFETIPQAYSRMKIIISRFPRSWPPHYLSFHWLRAYS